MVNIEKWMDIFLYRLNDIFGDRVWFVGLQGSYGRGEATETSDVDVVVILDTLSTVDIQAYSAMLDTLSNRERICGFLSGKDEILNWDPSDLFQFYHDTSPIQGNLDTLLERIDDMAITRAIKIGVCNIYHSCVHNMLHEKSEDVLRGLYKSASFIVQAIAFRQTGNYIRHQRDLLSVVSSNERAIIEICLNYKIGQNPEFVCASEVLFLWSKEWIVNCKESCADL